MQQGSCPAPACPRWVRILTVLVPLVLTWSRPACAGPTSAADARDAATGWLDEGFLRLGSHLAPAIASVDTHPGFHVVHLKPQGFIVVAADDGVEPVIAFAEHGSPAPVGDDPLWALLNDDMPRRTAEVRGDARLQPHGLQRHIARNQQRWNELRNRGRATLRGSTGRLALAQWGRQARAPGSVEPAPITITGMRRQDGYVELSHNARVSVSVQVSFDHGIHWRVLDSGVTSPVWRSKLPVRETTAIFRLEPDGLVDEMTLELFRNARPPLAASESVTDPSLGDDTTAYGLGSISDVRVSPIVQSRWSQTTHNGYPASAGGLACYNYYCPPYSSGDANNYPCGCVATAIGQVFRFHLHPSSGYGHSYVYSNMPLVPSSPSPTLTQRQAIGQMIRDIGTAVNMNYAAGGSGASLVIAAKLTGSFNYGNARDLYVQSGIAAHERDLVLRSNLAAGLPVIVGITGTPGGHAVVADGFGYAGSTPYYHLNMGWGSASDAWYNLPTIDSSPAFTSVVSLGFNIFPSGTGEIISGRVLSSGGAPIAGVTVTATATGASSSATTDSQGYYGVRVPSGRTYDVTASKAGYASATRSSIAVGTSQTAADYYNAAINGWGSCANVFGTDFTLSNFTLAAVAAGDSIVLRWSSPTSVGMASDMVYIRSRTDRYPADGNDGTLVYSGSELTCTVSNVDTSGAVTNFFVLWGNDGSPYASLGPNSQTTACADSGRLRLFWTSSAAGKAAIWFLKPDGSKRYSAFCGDFGAGWKLVGSGDINRDGVADLIWHGPTSGKVAYWMMTLDGCKSSSGYIGDITTGWTFVGSGDIDRDGTSDLIWYNATSIKAAYWLLNADGTKRSGGYLGTLTSGWAPAGVGDIDRDGTADLLWVNYTSGRMACWFLNSSGAMRAAAYSAGFSTGYVVATSRSN